MTWGSHCPDCGKADCKWVHGPVCQGTLPAFIEEHATLQRQLAECRAEREQAERSLRVVQNAAKTLASAQGSELEHLRQNAAFDHRLRRQHDRLMDRDAIMTDALLDAEARAERAEKERDRLREALAGMVVVGEAYLPHDAPNGPCEKRLSAARAALAAQVKP